jgi:hypothetical protein
MGPVLEATRVLTADDYRRGFGGESIFVEQCPRCEHVLRIRVDVGNIITTIEDRGGRHGTEKA